MNARTPAKVTAISPAAPTDDYQSRFIMAKSALLAVTDLMSEITNPQQLNDNTVMSLGFLLRDLATEMDEAFGAALSDRGSKS